ncbi:6-phosphofructokinase [Trifolium repens]|nr:6-phosphofructokinase [Trifolium repens]
MTQKIVIDLPLCCEKYKKKILEICTTADGVTTVTLEREGRDRVVIEGEDIDAARITECLRKKVTKNAKLVSM